MTGGTRHRSGLAAEEIAERLYRADGATVLARRWRCPEGELDLVLDLAGVTVFVEIKARRSSAEAAEALRPAQITRLGAAASRFLAEHGRTEARFDVVLVDRAGHPERIANALSFDG